MYIYEKENARYAYISISIFARCSRAHTYLRQKILKKCMTNAAQKIGRPRMIAEDERRDALDTSLKRHEDDV